MSIEAKTQAIIDAIGENDLPKALAALEFVLVTLLMEAPRQSAIQALEMLTARVVERLP